MNTLKALGWILTHLGRSRRKYPNIDSTSNALSRIGAKLEEAKSAAGLGGGPENLPLLGKTLLQTAGLCVRAVVDLALDHQEMLPMPEGEMGTEPWGIMSTDPTTDADYTVTRSGALAQIGDDQPSDQPDPPDAAATTVDDVDTPDWANVTPGFHAQALQQTADMVPDGVTDPNAPTGQN